MGGKCDTHGRDEKLHKISVKNVKRTEHLGDISVDGRIILNWFLKKSVVNGFIYLMI